MDGLDLENALLACELEEALGGEQVVANIATDLELVRGEACDLVDEHVGAGLAPGEALRKSASSLPQ